MKKLILNGMEKLGIPTKGIGFDYIKNTGWVGFSKIFESILSYLIIVLISRHLGAEGLGQYSFLFSFAGIFFILGDFGLATLLIRNLSNEKNPSEFFSKVYSLIIILSFIVLVIFMVVVNFIGKPELLIPLFIVGVLQFSSTLYLAPYGVLRVFGKGISMSTVNVVERVLVFIGALIILPLFSSLALFLFFALGATILKAILVYYFSSKNVHFKFKFPRSVSILRSAFPFLLIYVFSFIYVQMDSIMLSFMTSDVVVGLYNSAYKLINILNVFPALLLTFGFPIFSQLSKSKQFKTRFFEIIIKSCIYVIVPIIFGVFLVGDRVLEFIYGFGSVESFLVLKILIVAELFVFLTEVFGYFLASTGDELFFSKIGFIAAAFNIVLNFILIPLFSLYGAAIATVLTYMLIFIFMFNKIRFHFKFKFWSYFVIPLISSLLMYLVLFFLLEIHLLLILAIGALTYLVTLFILYFIKKKMFL